MSTARQCARPLKRKNPFPGNRVHAYQGEGMKERIKMEIQKKKQAFLSFPTKIGNLCSSPSSWGQGLGHLRKYPQVSMPSSSLILEIPQRMCTQILMTCSKICAYRKGHASSAGYKTLKIRTN